MANGIIDYNGFQIASGALDDGTLEFMRQRGLLPPVDGGFSGPAPMPKVPQPTAGDAFLQDIRQRGRAPQAFNAAPQIMPMTDRPSPLAPLEPEPVQPETMAEERQLQVAAEAPRSVTPQSPLRQRTPEEMILEGTRGALQNEAQVAGRSAQVYDQIRQDRQRMIDQTQIRQQQLQEARAQLDEDRAKAREEYDKAEPKGYWEGKSSGERVLAGLAMGLGAFGSALSGSGRNIAYDIITDEINRDTALQREKREKLRGKVEDVDNQYDRLFKIYQNESLVENELFNLRAEDAINYLEQIKLEGVEDNVKNQIDLTIGKLQQDIQDRRMNQLKTLSEIQAKQKDASGLTREEYEKRLIPGVGLAATEKDRNEAVIVNETTLNALNNINEMLNLREQYGAELTNRNVVNRQKQLATDTLLIFKELAKLGILSESDEKLLDRLIPRDPTAVEFGIEGKLEGLRNLVVGKANEFYKTRGLQSPFGGDGRPISAQGQISPQQTQLEQSLKAYEAMLQRDPNNADAREAVELIKRQLGR